MRIRERRAVVAAAFATILAGCGGDEADAYGNFEAEEIVVSAEVGGQLTRFGAEEGTVLPAGAVVGQIDTSTLVLQRNEVGAQQRSASGRAAEAEAQIDVLEAQLATAIEEYERTARLYRAEAATARQLNLAEGEVRVLRERIEAARVQQGVARQEVGGVGARRQQIEQRIADSRVTNPSAGTVLATYAAAGEYVQPGQPLYRIADLGTMTLRAYVSGAQLADVKLGSEVTIRIDAGAGEYRSLRGRVVWIASEAEFTPTPIQTREERADLVYAVEVQVANPEGVLKIGMPGELIL
ncbi:MAG TPA: HlyD family efflux transporter periplasmic adaptor subunit [Longimicrobiales bacterium]